MNKFIILVLTISISNLFAQNKTIRGRIIGEDLEALPYCSIYLNGNEVFDKSDKDGYFQIEFPVTVKNIKFGCVGFELANIIFDDNCKEMEVIMISDVNYDFITLKKVDRLRMRMYKKLPKIRKEAYLKGLFKSEKHCYLQEFVPYYKKGKVRFL